MLALAPAVTRAQVISPYFGRLPGSATGIADGGEGAR